MHILGVDIGGSGIKGAVVDTVTGELITERHRIETPQPATPEAVAAVLAQLVLHFNWTGPVGCGFPAAIQHGVARTASNISKAFIGTDIDSLFSEATNCPCYCVNDADAAGMAEMQFGEGAGRPGVVLLVTIGTGLGSALFTDGHLIPNTELGHMYLDNGLEAERYASDAVRKVEDLGWKSWGNRFNAFLTLMENLFWPDLIILGGGASKKFDKFKEQLKVEAPVKTAAFLNQAGIVGAALFAKSRL
ncbi:polyphosphate--glucose phosphotransferase [Methylomonas methanica]|uniref:Polyphosphate--glucose phosphotransferase n=1 Tax=Methylomonas methanica (strain DSM 25384 / MC09) TaxID=857087 RepID=F9ZWS2_METMM|nr:ROK family protein [Methylomonas methanica]AEG02084.1 Polyphosphate--glucose phosphotransferase [Methylomonas methanica MC09]